MQKVFSALMCSYFSPIDACMVLGIVPFILLGPGIILNTGLVGQIQPFECLPYVVCDVHQRIVSSACEVIQSWIGLTRVVPYRFALSDKHILRSMPCLGASFLSIGCFVFCFIA